jgi:UDP-N-acetylmuramoyl-tripeptide--D-alanyl-D-alanine ligase
MREFLDTEAISRGCGGVLTGSGELHCRGVCIDSRRVQKGDCFFAIKGDRFDGHRFVEQAFERGAYCAVLEKSFDSCGIKHPLIKVDDTTKALGTLAAFYRGRLGAKVVAITGSVGKTSCRDMVACVLARRYRCHSAKKSFNNHIGLPLTILEADSDCEVLILELGTNHPGEIEYLSRIAAPDIALITKVAAAHIEHFGTIENIAKEKAAISAGLKSGGKLIVNASSPELIAYLDNCGIEYSAYQIDGCYELYGRAGRLVIEGLPVTVPLPGRGSLENAMAAYLLCRELGMGLDEFRQAIAEVKASDMRLDILEVNGVKVINDCYNANPQSMANAVEVLAGFNGAVNRTVAVCGDMLELGAGGDEYHREIAALCVRSEIDVLAAVGDFSGTFADAAAREADLLGHAIEIYKFPDTDSLCGQINGIIKAGDAVLFKGSRSVGLEKAVNAIVDAKR